MSIESAMEGKEVIVENEESKDLNSKSFPKINSSKLYYVDYKNNRYSLWWRPSQMYFCVYSTGNKMMPQTLFEKNDVITLVGKKKGMGKLEVTVGEFKTYSKYPLIVYHGDITPSSIKQV